MPGFMKGAFKIIYTMEKEPIRIKREINIPETGRKGRRKEEGL